LIRDDKVAAMFIEKFTLRVEKQSDEASIGMDEQLR
jgi:hypothetical protein